MKKLRFILEVILMSPFVHPNRWKWEYKRLRWKYGYDDLFSYMYPSISEKA